MIRKYLEPLLGVFSRRHAGRRFPADEVPEAVRNRIFLICRDLLQGRWRQSMSSGDYSDQFWSEIHSSMQHAYGRLQLSPSSRATSPIEDILNFLPSCPPEEFLDFVELIFRAQCLFHVLHDENQLVDAFNDVFRAENAPFQVTPMVKEVDEEAISDSYPFGGGHVIRTMAYPKVIRVEEEATYSEAIAPALSVLADPAFSVANSELRGALEDYRNDDFSDCLAKCGSSFESVMKVICGKRQWPFGERDTASPLLKTIIPRTGLDGFFEQPLILVATMRNRLSAAHGGGTTAREVPRHVAQFALTTTAAAILLLVHETTK